MISRQADSFRHFCETLPDVREIFRELRLKTFLIFPPNDGNPDRITLDGIATVTGAVGAYELITKLLP